MDGLGWGGCCKKHKRYTDLKSKGLWWYRIATSSKTLVTYFRLRLQTSFRLNLLRSEKHDEIGHVAKHHRFDLWRNHHLASRSHAHCTCRKWKYDTSIITRDFWIQFLEALLIFSQPFQSMIESSTLPLVKGKKCNHDAEGMRKDKSNVIWTST